MATARRASHRARDPRAGIVAALIVIALCVALAVFAAVVFLAAWIGATPS